MENKWYIRGNEKYAQEIQLYFETKANVTEIDCDFESHSTLYYEFMGTVDTAFETSNVGHRIIEEYREIPLSEVLAEVNKKEYKLKPFDKVLVRDDCEDKWKIEFYSHYDKDAEYPVICLESVYMYCIPYEGNEHLLGTNDSPK